MKIDSDCMLFNTYLDAYNAIVSMANEVTFGDYEFKNEMLQSIKKW